MVKGNQKYPTSHNHLKHTLPNSRNASYVPTLSVTSYYGINVLLFVERKLVNFFHNVSSCNSFCN